MFDVYETFGHENSMKDKRIVRIIGLPRSKPSKLTLTLEVILQGDSIKKGMRYLGFFSGDFGERYPFILLEDGRIDFGSDYDVERFASTNLLSHKRIAVGEMFTTNEIDEDTEREREFVYSIQKIIDL